MNSFRLQLIAKLLAILLVLPVAAHAQPAPPSSAMAPSAPIYTQQQLDQLLAPIALYPDPLLTQVLIAASYPQQVVEAAQWLQEPTNAALNGDALVAALQPLQWDPSVKSLAAFPQIIAMMDQHLDWTEALGLAVANQQNDTMAQIQFLRQQAVNAGNLATTPQLAVRHDGPIIEIEPAEAGMVYVPVYNPAIIYGNWPYSAYPPIYLPPPPGFFSGTLGVGLAFSTGFAVVAPLWGWGHPNWGNHTIAIDERQYTGLTYNHQPSPGGSTWRHRGPVTLMAIPRAPSAPAGEHPPGTASPSIIVVPGPAPPRPEGGPGPAVARPPAVPAHPAEPTLGHVPQPPAPPHPPAPAVERAPQPPAPPPHPPAPAVEHAPERPAPPPHPLAPAVEHAPERPAPPPHPAAPAAVRPPPAPPHPPAPAAHPPGRPGEPEEERK